jgi:DNA-binding response OmpR family regulator
MRVLLVEDYAPLARSMVQGLREAGFAVDSAAEGDEALALADTNPYDAIILDIMVPKVDGLEIVRRLRAKGSRTAILIITARDQVQDRIEGLNLGADDYLPKPFVFDEVLARLRAIVRRRYQGVSNTFQVGDLEVDLGARVARRGGTPIALSGREYALLEYLVLRRGQIVTRGEIWTHVYDFAADPSSNVVDVYIGYLRKKLASATPGAPPLIRTHRGIGYSIGAEGGE